MKNVTLAISALAVFAFSAGMATAQMQPIPNPPESHHMMMHHHMTHHQMMMMHHHHHMAPKHDMKPK